MWEDASHPTEIVVASRLWRPAECGSLPTGSIELCAKKMKKRLDDCEVGGTQQIVAPNVQNALNFLTEEDVKERNESKRDELEAGRSEEIEALSQQNELKNSIEEESAPCLDAHLDKWADDFLQQEEIVVSSQHDALAVPTEQEMSACLRAELDAWTRAFVEYRHHVACIGMYSLLPRSLQRQVQQQLKVLGLEGFQG